MLEKKDENEINRDLLRLYGNMALEVLMSIKEKKISYKEVARDMNITNGEFVKYMRLEKTNYGIYASALKSVSGKEIENGMNEYATDNA